VRRIIHTGVAALLLTVRTGARANRAALSPSVSGSGRSDLPSRRLISVTRRIGHAAPYGARLSGDGRFVAFTSEVEAIDLFGRHITFGSRSRDLDPAATNGVRQVYMRDRLTGKTIVVSRRAGAHGALGDRSAAGAPLTALHHDGARVRGRQLPRRLRRAGRRSQTHEAGLRRAHALTMSLRATADARAQ
jgi:hypothetical protein